MVTLTDETIDELTNVAVQAALKVIDDATENESNKSTGPCGDALAGAIDKLIRSALIEQFGE